MRKKVLKAADKGLEKSLEFYERFLPTELCAQLGATDMENLSFRTQKKLEAAIMYLNIAGFQELVRLKQTAEIYALINEMVSLCIPVVYDRGGVVNDFMDAGFSALFLTDPGEAVKAAVHLCESLQKKEGGFLYWGSFSMGIAYGSVMAGIVGHERRMSPLTLSVYTGLSKHLQTMAVCYGSKILITGTMADQIPNFSKEYNQRLLGYLYIKNGSFIEKLYDVFDGDTAMVRNQKRKTKTVFEKGVRLFSEADYKQARYYFIEVLKTDHQDRAARSYIQLCDKPETSAAKEGIFVEIY